MEIQDIVTSIRQTWKLKSAKHAFGMLNKAKRQFPKNIDLQLLEAEMWMEFGKEERAEKMLRKLAEEAPEHPELNRLLSRSCSQFLKESELPASLANPENPIISAIVSTYNAEKFIEGLLVDLLSQTIADQTEIIVIDSGSEQNEKEIVERYQKKYQNIRYLRTERETVYQAWNRGVKMARGKYLTNANTDDRHRPDAFELHCNTLEEHPEIALVYGDCMITFEPNETFYKNSAQGIYQFHEHDVDVLLDGKCYVGPMPVWRASLHKKHGFFNEYFVTSGDYEFWTRLAVEGEQFLHQRQVTGIYLDRPESIEKRSAWEKKKENKYVLQRYGVHTSQYLGDLSFSELEERDVHLSHLLSNSKNKMDEVIAACNGILKKRADDVDYLFLKSSTLLRQGKTDAGMETMRLILEINPEHALTLNNLAILDWQKGRQNEAIQFLEKVTDIDAKNAEARINLAEMYLKRKQPDKAKKHLKEILHHNAMHPETHKLLRDIYNNEDMVQSNYHGEIYLKTSLMNLM